MEIAVMMTEHILNFQLVNFVFDVAEGDEG